MFSLSRYLFCTKNFRHCKILTLGRQLSDSSAQCLSGENVKKGVILGMHLNDNNEPELTPAACKFNEKMSGKLLELINLSGKWEKGVARSFNNIEDEFWSVAVVCLGRKGQHYNQLEAIDESRESVRAGAGAAAQLLHRQRINQIFVEGLGRAEQAAEGASLAVWRYDEFKNKAQRFVQPTVELYDDPDVDGWQKGIYMAEAQNLARRLTDAPANYMTPTAFSHEIVNALCPCGIKVDIHDKDWIENQRMVGLLAAARGSCEPPVFLELHYCGGPVDERPIVLIGKSTTFDAGGLCMKRCLNMSKYRADMSGGASIVAIIRAAALLSLPLNLIGVIGVCENMPSGMAMRVGDIIKYNNGVSVEIENTDFEGHLVLSDCFIYSMNTHRPRLILDITTMTEDIRGLLGSAATGTFSNSEYMWKQIRKAGVITGDRCWRLPLWKFYKRRVGTYTHVDLNNKGHKGRTDGVPCLAAAYLSYFIDCVDWVHLDTTGVGMTAMNKIYPYITRCYMQGRPVRTVVQFLIQLVCPNECDQPY